jgi:hypothetical protein
MANKRKNIKNTKNTFCFLNVFFTKKRFFTSLVIIAYSNSVGKMAHVIYLIIRHSKTYLCKFVVLWQSSVIGHMKKSD